VGNILTPVPILGVFTHPVPEAEVIPGFLNVGFGDVGYQGVTELEAAYIERISRGGLREADVHTRKYPHIYNFLVNFQVDKLVI